MKPFLLVFIFSFLSLSCNVDKTKEKVVGTWSIDELRINGENAFHILLANIMSFNGDWSCLFPYVEGDEGREGAWEIYCEDDTLHYITLIRDENMLSGKYRLYFEKDYDQKLLKMVFENDRIYLRATKGLKNFDFHKDNW